jgi:hypothetical protein
VAPERLEEILWKAVALMPKDAAARERGTADARVADGTIFLDRCDRQVADVFLAQALAFESGGVAGNVRSVWPIIRAKAVADPHGAAGLLLSLPAVPVAPGQGTRLNHPTDDALEALITCLVEPIDEHWKAAWRSAGISVGRPRFR